MISLVVVTSKRELTPDDILLQLHMSSIVTLFHKSTVLLFKEKVICPFYWSYYPATFLELYAQAVTKPHHCSVCYLQKQG